MTSCATGYKLIKPDSINYISTNQDNEVKLEYKYDLLDKRYAGKEAKKEVKLVAVKITNESDKDLMFGRDIKLTYENGKELFIMENDKIFRTLKQSPPSYLFYLLLTPLNLYTSTNTDGRETRSSSIPVGLVLGPALAGGNLITAASANKKFRTELAVHNINGIVIKKGETKYGLIGIKSNTFDALRIKLE